MTTTSGDALSAEACAQAVQTCACSNFRKVARAVTQLFDEALQPTGLRSTQLVILLAIKANPSPSIAQLARQLVMDASTLNRNLRPLEKRGLIQIADAQDGRRKVLRLTPEGEEAALQAVPHWQRAQSRLVENLGQPKWGQLVEQLDAVVACARVA